MIGFGNDHTGVELKKYLMAHLVEKGYECVDYGAGEGEKVDYPEPGRKVAEALVRGEIDRGVLICGTGLGISLAANKVPGVRAAVCSEPFTAQKAVQHNNCNIIAVGARVVGMELAEMIVDAFFDAEFEGGRHERRVNLICRIEQDYARGNSGKEEATAEADLDSLGKEGAAPEAPLGSPGKEDAPFLSGQEEDPLLSRQEEVAG